jgi:hypothetical protein
LDRTPTLQADRAQMLPSEIRFRAAAMSLFFEHGRF